MEALGEQDIQDLLDAAAQGEANEVIARDAGHIVVARFGNLLVVEKQGQVGAAHFLVESDAAEVFTQYKEQLA